MNKCTKNALITGAGSGIGAEIAKELAKKNYHTIITGKSISNLEETENAILENGGSCTLVELNMKDLVGIDKLGLEIFNRWKKLDILIVGDTKPTKKKVEKAKELQIKILREKEWNEILNS